jgi:hypothetical protein
MSNAADRGERCGKGCDRGRRGRAERAAWDAQIAQFQKSGALFGTVDYFLFTARG